MNKINSDKLQRRYTFKLYPTPEQEEELNRQCSMVATLWNAFLAMQEARYASVRGQKGVTHRDGEKSFFSEFDLGYEITALREADPEWRALSTWTARRVARAIVDSFEGFFRRAKQGAGKQAGYPKYKSFFKGQHNWLPHRFASGCKLIQLNKRSWHLKLKGFEEPIFCKGKFPQKPLNFTDADIRYRAGAWWFSVGTAMQGRRDVGSSDVVIRLDCLDKFAEVNGCSVHRFDVGLDVDYSDAITTIQQAMSSLNRQGEEYKSLKLQKSRLEAKAARKRKEGLHVWTTLLTDSAQKITLVAPEKIKEATQSGKGDEKNWGAAVALKSDFNKHILEQAPAMVIQMFEYKCAEAGIEFVKIEHNALTVGNHAVDLRKAARKTGRELKKMAG